MSNGNREATESVSFEDGKYTLIRHGDGRLEWRRYGEAWPAANPPDKKDYAILVRVQELEAENARLHAALAGLERAEVQATGSQQTGDRHPDCGEMSRDSATFRNCCGDGHHLCRECTRWQYGVAKAAVQQTGDRAASEGASVPVDVTVTCAGSRSMCSRPDTIGCPYRVLATAACKLFAWVKTGAEPASEDGGARDDR